MLRQRQEERVNKALIEHRFAEIIVEGLGLDLTDPNLIDTPQRVAKMYCNELLKNIGKEFHEFKEFPNDKKYDQIIMSDRIDFVSMCSHHFLPFTGEAWIAYIPGEKLTGLSKLARAVEHYSARPQLQENLCHEIINRIDQILQPKGTFVYMRAIHNCIRCRGVKQANSGMQTSAVSGVFKDNSLLEEKALTMINISLNSK